MAEGWLICSIIHWCIFNFIFSCYARGAKIFGKLLGVILFSLVLYTGLKTIKNEDELNKFIKENYGPKCLIGKRNHWKQEGVYQIIVRGEEENWKKQI